MSDLFGISVSALQALQTAISVTSNNIANANTPGYAKESVNLVTATPQTNGVASVGAGVRVSGILRSYSQAATNQLNNSQSSLGQLSGLQVYTNQIDNIIGTSAGGLSTSLQNYYNAWANVANAPTSTATRQALLSAAQGVASSFQSSSSQLQTLNTTINSGITSDVQQINSIATSISTLNQQIVVGTAQAGGQPPNDLIDQRDQLLSNLSKLVGVTTSTDSNGGLNVFVANGQPLVLQGNVTQLTTVPNPYNASQLEISTATMGKNILSGSITSGDLGGLLAARSQAVDPALNQLGQVATALAQSANGQQGAGLDLTGQLGAPLFSVGAPVATPANTNTGAVTATASVADVGKLTTNDYVLSYTGGAYHLSNATTGAAVAFTGAGTAASPLSADGLSIVLSGTPAAGDKFLIQPTAQAAGTFGVAITSPSQIAAAGAIQTAASATNTGAASISSGTVLDATNPNLLTSATIQFTSPTTYTINGGASNTYTAGGNIAANGWQVQITGTPAAGDSFTVQGNTAGGGDNRNALASAALQNQGVLAGGTISVNGAVSALITGIGGQAQQVNSAQTAQASVNAQALQTVQSISGVNMNEEAANLLQWQQAFQASAQAMSIGNQMFTNLMSALSNGIL
ncbi:MAG: flagellar hook-associated protein FlgK [Gammaproteobacteria bacterium]|nr:flagellar hook-associated protein FlgK [Gammaproteobacteria bacterium]